MSWLDAGKLAIEALRRYPLRTAMLLLAIAIGVAAVVMLTAVGEGARRYVTGQFAALGTHLLIVLPGRAETAGAGIQGMLIGETARELTLQDTIAIGRSPRIGRVTPVVPGSGTASWRARERDITVLGTSSPMLEIQHWSMQSGRFLPPGDLDIAQPVCVLGATVANELFSGTAPAGSMATYRRFALPRDRHSRPTRPDRRIQRRRDGVLPVANAQQLFNTSSVFRILAEATSRETIQGAKRDILSIIKQRHAGEEDVTVVTQDAVVVDVRLHLRNDHGRTRGHRRDQPRRGRRADHERHARRRQSTNGGDRLAQSNRCAQRPNSGAVPHRSGVPVDARRGHRLRRRHRRHLALRMAFPTLDFVAPPWASLSAVAVALASGLVFGILPARRAAALDPVNALMRR